ncbi:MAG TPA: zinc ribbon domain-containing protein [Solirubrobacteraceae bacterium]|jgi:predicted nucleic acid-binding Zn ribbon protein
MPIYEYRRPDGTRFELQQSFSEEPLRVDPDTGVPVERVLHAPAVHFKGKGFYNTDYGTRRRNRETAAAAEKSSESNSSSSDTAAKSDGAGKADAGKADAASTGKKDAAKKDAKPVASKS